MRVTCHPSFGEIDAARWEDLWRRAPQSNVYQTRAWYAAYERHLGAHDSLRILVAEENSRWIGAAALEIADQSIGPVRRRVLTLMSSLSAAYPLDQGPLFDGDRGDAALEALARAIAAMGGFTAFHGTRFEAGSSADRLLAAVARAAGQPPPETTPPIHSHLVELLGDYDLLLASMGPMSRKSVRRFARRFEEAGHAVRLVAARSEVDPLIDTLRRQKHETFRKRGDASSFDDPRLAAFLADACKALFDQGRMTGIELRIAGAIGGTAILLHDEHGHCYAYNNSFDPQHRDMRPHYVLDGAAAREAIRRGFPRIDLSTGSDDHKLHWSRGNTRALLERAVVRRPLRNLPFDLARRARHHLKPRPVAPAAEESGDEAS
jgi:CelD/BcsL family acetyltransferase involved in cellulose biosynthesis